MLNFEELDNNYAVEFDLNKTCRFAYLWNKKDSIYNPNNEKFITVSEAYRKLKDLKYHFYPAGYFVETYYIGYELNNTLGNCNDLRETLYLVGKRDNKKFEPITSVGDVVDTTIEVINREIRLVNYMLGFSTENEIFDTDAISHSKTKLLEILENDKLKYDRFID